MSRKPPTIEIALLLVGLIIGLSGLWNGDGVQWLAGSAMVIAPLGNMVFREMLERRGEEET